MVAVTPAAQADVTLAHAVIEASSTPLLLLDTKLVVVSVSSSFCAAFSMAPETVLGTLIYDLGDHRWNLPKLRSLLGATMSGLAAVEGYEIDIDIAGRGIRRLLLKPQMLRYGAAQEQCLLLAIADVTDDQVSARAQADMARDWALLTNEVQHRVANSLQIIASILMQSARKVQSAEARGHLTDAHQRVMSIATLQRQLAETGQSEIELGPYLTQLCESIGASMIYDHRQLALSTRIDRHSVAAETSASMGLVVTELVINAVKHAFPENRRGRIEVDYATSDAEWTLSVTDDGIGMPAAPNLAPSGLGTSIVQALAKQLNAEIEVTDNGPGTKVSLVHRRKGGALDAANDATDDVAV